METQQKPHRRVLVIADLFVDLSFLLMTLCSVSLQTEDHELWATHFDSLHRRPPVQIAAPSAPPPAPSNGSDRGEWEPTSSLSLVWEAMSSCGAESVGGASTDMTSGYPTRAKYGSTMNKKNCFNGLQIYVCKINIIIC